MGRTALGVATGGLSEVARAGSKSSGLKDMMGTGRFTADAPKIKEGAFKKQLAGSGNQENLRKEQDALRERQKGQTSRLEDSASGKSPSLAEAELKAASRKSLAQQLATAKSGRGGNAAARERQLAKGQQAAGRDVAEQASIRKLQEQQMAEQMLAQQLTGVQSQVAGQRSQDIGVADADRASLQALEALKAKSELAAQGMNLSGFQSASQARSGAFGGAMGGLAMMMSDKNCKKKIKSESYSDEKCKKDIKEEIDSIEINVPKAPKKEGGMDMQSMMSMAKMAGSSGAASSSDENCKKDIKAEKLGAALSRADHRKSSFSADEKDSQAFHKKFNAIKEAHQKRKAAKLSGKDRRDKMKSFGMSDKAANKRWNKEQAAKGIKLASERKSKDGESSFSKFAKGYKKGSAPSKAAGRDVGASLAERLTAEISDKNCKQNVQKEDFNPKSFLDKLSPYSYEYKDSHKGNAMGGEGRYLSVMAQQLEKAGPVGKSMVEENENGKYVDYGKGFGAILAAQTHLNQRLAELEKKKK